MIDHRSKRMKKKAVSPLIATVLLIAFAVALGAVVMNWGRSYVEETAEKARTTSDTKVSCSMDVNMKFVVYNGKKRICYNETDDIIKFTLENTGSKNIESIQAKVYGANSIYINDSLKNSSMKPSYPLKSNISYDFTEYGDIQKVSLTQAIKVPGKIESVLCADNALEVEDMSVCT